MNTTLYNFFDILSYLGHPIVVSLTMVLIFFIKVFEEVNDSLYLPSWDRTIKLTIFYMMMVLVFIPHVIRDHFYTSMLRDKTIELLSSLPSNRKIYIKEEYPKETSYEEVSDVKSKEIISALKRVKFQLNHGGGAGGKSQLYTFIVKIETTQKTFKFFISEQRKKVYGYSIFTDYFNNKYEKIGVILNTHCFDEYKD